MPTSDNFDEWLARVYFQEIQYNGRSATQDAKSSGLGRAGKIVATGYRWRVRRFSIAQQKMVADTNYPGLIADGTVAGAGWHGSSAFYLHAVLKSKLIQC